jgi:uncharacterized protein (DUF58 family)
MKRGQAAAIGAGIQRVFPLTPQGLVITAAAMALAAAGALRADLAALFWGSSFLLFTLYALAAGHLFRISLLRRRAADPDFASLTLPASGITAGERTEAVAAARLPRAFPPGFTVLLSCPLAWHARRIGTVRTRLAPGESRKLIGFTAEHRGLYAGSAETLEMRDVLGFTAHRLSLPQEETLAVLPPVRPREAVPPVMEQTDESAVYALRRRRSESLLEARKYYPGDDVRRLNWKLFAHMDELYLRVGEEVPPPESRLLFVLDTTAHGLVPRRCAADYLDALVESCASLMAGFLERGIELSLSLPGEGRCRSWSGEALPTLLAVLADAWWTDGPWAPDLPARPMHAVVLSSPGSPGLPGIIAAVRARGWRASLFLQGLPQQSPPVRLPTWPRRLEGLLFLPDGAPRVPARAARRERASFSEAMARELSLYGEPGSGVLHAAEI